MIKYASAMLALLMGLFGSVAGLAAEPAVREAEVPVIMYHSLSEKPGDRWTLDPASFERDLACLREKGYTAVTVGELVDFVDGRGTLPEKPVVLTFDDCYYNNMVHALPMLEKYDGKMVLSVIGELSQQFSQNPDDNADYGHLSWRQLGEMAATGRVELANHTWGMHNHDNGRDGCCRLPGEDLEAYNKLLREDVQRVQQALESAGGETPLCFTYPFGSKCPEALEVLKEMGFRATLSCYEGLNHIQVGDVDCLYELRRCNRTPDKSVEQILSQLGCV